MCHGRGLACNEEMQNYHPVLQLHVCFASSLLFNLDSSCSRQLFAAKTLQQIHRKPTAQHQRADEQC